MAGKADRLDRGGGPSWSGHCIFSDSVEERLSWSHRFGIELSFYGTTVGQYLDAVQNYFREQAVPDMAAILVAAKIFATERGGYSGWTAWHFYRRWSSAQ